MEFCPKCTTWLEVSLGDDDQPSRYRCPACPYICPIEDEPKSEEHVRLVKKKIEPVIEDHEWENATPIDETCPKCSRDKAVYIEIPISDYVKSIAYKCLSDKCGNKWFKDVHM